MIRRYMIVLFAIVQSFTASCQQGPDHFTLTMINNSSWMATCTISGNEKRDTLNPWEKKNILFEPETGQISFYLDLLTIDLSSGARRYKMIRVLNTLGAKEIIVTADGQMKYELTPEEKVIAEYDPRLRRKNFWKIDSVIHANSNNIAAADIIYLSICDIEVPTDTIHKYYNLLSPEIRSSDYGKRIADYIGTRDKLIIGKVLGNFELPDTKGNSVQLKDIKSNYVLLDFWFSRCGPCVASFPEIKALYGKTKRNKLAVIGISSDTKSDNELWLETISKYDMVWMNLNDPKSKLVKSLAVGNYPTRVLLDKDRKIIMLDTDNSQDDFFRRVEKLATQ